MTAENKEHSFNVLLVEDDPNLGDLLQEFLDSENFNVTLSRDGVEGLKSFQSASFDICILDVMLPKKDGFTLGKQIRAQNENIPIIYLTAKSLKEDKLEGFKIGADDYMTKPFDEEELVLRMLAILKRSHSKDSATTDIQVFEIGKYRFDYPNQTLHLADTSKKITAKESEVLRLLCIHKNKILKREKALITIYGENDYFFGRSFDVFITKLRKYLKADANIKIENIHGVGFRLIEN